MKSFLQIENLTKSFGDRVLFSGVTFGVYEGDKIGLIAKNGSGKTTLLRIIAGEEPYDSGDLVFRHMSREKGRTLMVNNRSSPITFDTWIL